MILEFMIRHCVQHIGKHVKKHGLLQDIRHWYSALEEAASVKAPAHLRQLFAIMLQNCDIGAPLGFWNAHKHMAEDYLHITRLRHPEITVDYNEAVFAMALQDLQNTLNSMGGFSLSKFGLPEIQDSEATFSAELLLEQSYNINDLPNFINTNEPLLLDDQREALNAVLNTVDSEQGAVFFIDAPGGTGKTFLTNLLLAKVRQLKYIAIAVASSGIAATLLKGGRTAHSTFKLPLDLSTKENPLCNISKGSAKAKLLKECKLIVWDEATMSHKGAFEALDKTLQDIRNNNQLMGGVSVVLSGDFRQTLPVIVRGTRADEINACIKSSYLWGVVQVLQLKTNMRVHIHNDEQAGHFAQQLLQLGNGLLPARDGNVTIPFGTLLPTEEDLLSTVFRNIHCRYTNYDWLSERVILASKNDTVDNINSKLLDKLPGEIKHYKSIDTVPDPEESVNFPTEFLNSLQPAGLPPHHLTLKIGAPIILLRNLHPPRLCNGTRLVVTQLLSSIIEAVILTGPAKGEHAFIPRIPLILSDLPGCNFTWLFPDGYEALAFNHQRVTFCFPADIGLQALFFLVHNIFNAVQTSSSFFSAGV